MKLTTFKETNYSVIQYPITMDISSLIATTPTFLSITYTADECSVVAKTDTLDTSQALQVDPDWKIIQVVGILDFSLVGILAKLSDILAREKISIFAISTFNTDYLLVKENNLANAQLALEAAGYQFI